VALLPPPTLLVELNLQRWLRSQAMLFLTK